MSVFKEYPGKNFAYLIRQFDYISMELWKHMDDEDFTPTKKDICEIIVLFKRYEHDYDFVKKFKSVMVERFTGGQTIK